MKKGLMRGIPTAALSVILAIAASAGVALAEKNRYPMTMKDSMGDSFTLKKEPQRIVSIAPSTTEILFALGLGTKVVGVSTYCDYPAEAVKKEKVGTFSQPSLEKILSLKPDLVLGAAGVNKSALKQLDDLGVPVIVCDARTVDGTKQLIRLVGKAADAVDEANALVASMQKRLDKVTDRIAKADKRTKVFYELWYDPVMTAGPGTFIDDLIGLAGGVNIAADAKTDWPVYSLETIIDKNPDLFIYAHGAESIERIKARKGWQTVKAIKNGRIVLLPDENVVSRPGPRIVEGVEVFAKAIHPDLFR